MKRIACGVMGFFLAANALAFTTDATNETAIGGTAFSGISDQNGLNHFGNGIFNNSGATKGVTGTITLRELFPVVHLQQTDVPGQELYFATNAEDH